MCNILTDESSRRTRRQDVKAEDATVNEKEKLNDPKESRKRLRALKELEDLKVDSAGRVEADRTAIRRKIQTFLSRNDEITAE